MAAPETRRKPDPWADPATPPKAEPEPDDFLRAAPALGRLAAEAWWRTARWSVEASVGAGTRMVRSAISGESPADVLAQAGGDLRDYLRRLLGLVEGEPREEETPPVADPPDTDSLRERGAELLRQSADVDYEEAAHPAYERILGSLAPDEARILRLLALEGPQPAVDVRGAKGIPVSTQMIAPGLSMIGQQAGVRYLDRVPAYLNNLYRLGLIWFSREPLEDPLRYQVLEAQPDVAEALRKAGRARKTVRRSIMLTPFGEDFCEICLPLDTAEIDALGTDGTKAAEEAPGRSGEG
jgi:hypothetical protein